MSGHGRERGGPPEPPNQERSRADEAVGGAGAPGGGRDRATDEVGGPAGGAGGTRVADSGGAAAAFPDTDRRGPGPGGTPGNPAYTRYHPKWHRPRIPIFWWLRSPAYVIFIARELTSVAVGYAGLLILLLTWNVARGPEAYGAMLGFLARPGILAVHAFVLLALVFHSVTWLNLTPQALPRRIGGRRIRPWSVLAGHYLAWLVVSAILVWIVAVKS